MTRRPLSNIEFKYTFNTTGLINPKDNLKQHNKKSKSLIEPFQGFHPDTSDHV